jgi:hypothetical protein
MQNLFSKKIKIILILIILLSLTFFINSQAKTRVLKGKDPKTNLILEILLGYAFPINASFLDVTYVNTDYYWNPHSGITADLRFTLKLHEYVFLALPIDVSFGIYQYTTGDGSKVGTEAAAGHKPITRNTEWSFTHDFVPMVYVKPGKHAAVPYLGLGVGVSVCWSWETWEFTNVDDEKVKLVIQKSYLPNPAFKGEFGWIVPINKRLSFRIAGFFTLTNAIMIRVELTNYYINDEDTIGEWDEKSRVYNYAFNAPDENKGGDCLLGGFNFDNHPQQKIGTNAGIKLGFGINF